MNHLLTIITFVPIVGAALILLIPSSERKLIQAIAVFATLPQILIATYLYQHFDTATTAMQFVEKTPWVPTYHIDYFVGVDGISISMVLLTALICFISVFASFGIDKAIKGYFALLLMLDAGMMGVSYRSISSSSTSLGSHAAADVFSHRHLGRSASRIRSD